MRRIAVQYGWEVGTLTVVAVSISLGLLQEPRGPEVIVDDGIPGRAVRIAVAAELTIGDDDGPGSLTWSDVYTRDSRGRFYVVDEIQDGITVFDSTGQFSETIGREGEGPGEYRLIVGILAGVGDTIFVLDGPNQRLSVLDPEYGLVRSIPVRMMPITGQWARISPDQFLVNGIVMSQSRYGHPFHIVQEADGSVSQSFGLPAVPITPANERPLLARRIAVSDKRLYAAFRQQLAVEEWSLEGEHIRTLRRDVKWFSSYGGPLGVLSMQEAPKPILYDVHLRDDGLLWVGIRVPDKDWKAGLESVTTADGLAYRSRSPELIYDTRIEIWDLSTVAVIADTVIDQAVVHFLDDDHVIAERRVEATGVQKHQLLHVYLTRY